MRYIRWLQRQEYVTSHNYNIGYRALPPHKTYIYIFNVGYISLFHQALINDGSSLFQR